MNKNMFFGWTEVCKFSYVQSMKSKAMLITLAILCGLILVSVPIVTMFTEKSDKTETTKIEEVYFYTDSELLEKKLSDIQFSDSVYRKVKVEWISKEESDKKISLLEKKNDNSVVVQFLVEENPADEEYGVQIKLQYGEESDVKKSDAERFATYLLEHEEDFLLTEELSDNEKLASMLKDSEYVLYQVDKNGEIHSDENRLDGMEYSIVYAYLMVSMFAILIAGSKVAELIVTEKTSKVIDYLLTSVRPLSLLAGKVAGTMLIVFTLIGCMAVSLFASLAINSEINQTSLVPRFLSEVIESGAFKGVTITGMLTAFLIFLFGFLFFALLAGLAGATVSKVEEMAEGIKLFTFAIVIGVYLGLILIMMAASAGSASAFSYFVYYLPLSSVFIVPVYLLIGKISFVTGLISLGILVISTVLLGLFVSRVFESVLFNNGSVMKLKDIIAVYKMSKKGSSSEGKDGK